jgi:cytidyltransferase-like protein
MTLPALEGKAEIRVYVDMVADMFHYGHARFIKNAQAHVQASYPTARIVMIVGITNDACLADYKRVPVFSNAERVEMVEACRYVDEVLGEVPLVTTVEFCKQHGIDLVAHGDDFTPEKASLYYAEMIALGRYFSVPYTPSVSTTNIIQRIVDRFGTSAGAV